ncbi:polysaccharide biosynthesis tyrosine autokinase [Flavobacteriales bacterium]|nr:polysaccharide biosynthesis tyrosine autokinase [Flavobacteriales bacterium]
MGGPEYKEDELDLGKVLFLVLENWLFYAFSIVACLIIAYGYAWYTHPMYKMSTTVLVNDEGNDISQSILDEVGVMGKKRNIENEIAILGSRSLMEKAIATLNLNTSYAVDLGMRTRDLYSEVPLQLDLRLNENVPPSFTVFASINDTGTSSELLWQWTVNDDDREMEQTVAFGEGFSNELGHFRLNKTKMFESMVIGDSALSQNYTLTYRSTDLLATRYLDLLKVSEARDQASILLLALEDRKRQRGVDLLNALLNVYIQNNIEKKNQLASNSLKFIDNQLAVIIEDLENLENNIKSFKISSGISDVSAEASFFLEQVSLLDQSTSEIDVKLSIIAYLEEYITSDKDLKNASPSSLGIEDPLLQSLISQLSEYNSERVSMLRFTKEDNPLINAIDTKIEETKSSLIKNTSSIRNGLLASKTEIKAQLNEVEKRVRTLPKAEYELLALQRQYSIKESLYLLLLEKKSENSIILASTVSDNLIIDTGRSADEPVAPKKLIIYLLGLLIGIGVPSIYLLMIALFDNRIMDKSDIAKVTSIPFLGIIPHHKENGYIVVADNVNSAIAESFRSIRTNISFLVRKDELAEGVSPKVVQVTSAIGSEGKSFCSINLAASLALGGGKTVIVGLDLRKPKLAEYFSSSNKVGASSVLAGINSLEEATISSDTANLDFIVAGPVPPNPSELLMGKGMNELLEALTAKYDHVVLDTPPIGLVTDSLIISEHVATTIYVIRQNVSNSRSLEYINDLYQAKKISNISILLNDVKTGRFNYGYGNGYYSESNTPTRMQRLLNRF